MNDTGILNIYKPAEMTSHDVVAIIRKKLGVKRVGHTGTLDPMATGVLPVCVGQAARITEYLDLDYKTYMCSMILGKTTDTQDIWGQVIEEKSTDDISEEDILSAFRPFRGIIDQKPPMYSAVRVNGRRLYEYAREGKEVEVKTRRIYIDDLTVKNIDLARRQVDFSVRCSKGTYIRTICQDVGLALGCGAAMSALERKASGAFKAEDAIPLEKIRRLEQKQVSEMMTGADFPLIHFGKVTVDSLGARLFTNGNRLPAKVCHIEREPEYMDKEPALPIRPEYRHAYNVYQQEGDREQFLGVAFFNSKYNDFKADKVLFKR